MTTVEESLVTLLESAVPEVEERIYPTWLPQKPVLPAITYFRVSTGRTESHQGDSRLDAARFQFSCWSSNYGETISIADKVLDALAGRLPGGEAGHLGDGRDLYDPEPGIFHRAIEVVVQFSR